MFSDLIDKSSAYPVITIQVAYIQGAPKSKPIGKIRYLWNGRNVFAKFTVLTEEDSGHIFCKFPCNYLVASEIITI